MSLKQYSFCTLYRSNLRTLITDWIAPGAKTKAFCCGDDTLLVRTTFVQYRPYWLQGKGPWDYWRLCFKTQQIIPLYCMSCALCFMSDGHSIILKISCFDFKMFKKKAFEIERTFILCTNTVWKLNYLTHILFLTSIHHPQGSGTRLKQQQRKTWNSLKWIYSQKTGGEAITNSEIQGKLESIIKLLLRIGRDADTTGGQKCNGIMKR
jgi:hypothetical protein